MEDLVKKLQTEAGLTDEQAQKAIKVVKEFMDKEGLNIDWEKFFKGKYEDMSEKAKSLFNKLTDKAEDLIDKAKDETKDLFK
ncbi:hypothetical protein [Dysgonomonas sp. 520]|uniref:hypothetical protein n=1 Tax=Dysgonomonas sp. 520 TaxID=2302931 RepID=UPI0013CFFF6D|nr:hypothetical protein [Dysgonomonas sp. 520]NDW09303.1 hypothetical protein [Dysgonomonas sp. 520]